MFWYTTQKTDIYFFSFILRPRSNFLTLCEGFLIHKEMKKMILFDCGIEWETRWNVIHMRSSQWIH